jgi:hypothetical protein
MEGRVFPQLHAKLRAGFERQKNDMIAGRMIAALLPTAARNVRRWLFHLGGLGLIPLGLLDSSLIACMLQGHGTAVPLQLQRHRNAV